MFESGCVHGLAESKMEVKTRPTLESGLTSASECPNRESFGPSEGSRDFNASSSKSIRSTRRSPYRNVLLYELLSPLLLNVAYNCGWHSYTMWNIPSSVLRELYQNQPKYPQPYEWPIASSSASRPASAAVWRSGSM